MSAMLAVLAAACFDPTAYGAVPDDGKVDTAPLQQAIDAAEEHGGDVCIPAGTFDLGPPPTRLATLWVTKGGITIRGVGDKTVLNLNGDGHKSDWYGLYLRGAGDVTIRDLTMTATRTTDTEEQTHLIQLGPGSHAVRLYNLVLGPMRRPDQKVGDGAGGDCLRLLGEANGFVEDVSVTNSRFVDCDRSGIGVQRGVRRLTVAQDQFSGIGDTPIDFEPTAWAPIEDIAFVDLRITRTPDAQGAYAITLVGAGKDNPTRRVVVAGCELDGGGISLLNTEQVVIASNLIRHGPLARDTIHIMRRVRDVLIQRNTIERPASSPAAPVIGLTHNNGGIPSDIHIVDNDLVQHTGAAVIDDVSGSSIEIRDNRITYDGADAVYAIEVRAIADQVDDIDVRGNDIRGPVAGVLRLTASRQSIGRVSLSHNRSDMARTSVACVVSQGTFRAPVIEDGDQLGGAQPMCPVLRAAAHGSNP